MWVGLSPCRCYTFLLSLLLILSHFLVLCPTVGSNLFSALAAFLAALLAAAALGTLLAATFFASSLAVSVLGALLVAAVIRAVLGAPAGSSVSFDGTMVLAASDALLFYFPLP